MKSPVPSTDILSASPHEAFAFLKERAARLYAGLRAPAADRLAGVKSAVRLAAFAVAAGLLFLGQGGSIRAAASPGSAASSYPHEAVFAAVSLTVPTKLTLGIFSDFPLPGGGYKPIVKPLAPTQGDFSDDPFKQPQCTWYVWARAKAVTGKTLTFKYPAAGRQDTGSTRWCRGPASRRSTTKTP